ncbi:zinc finger protein 782-like isoform X1 [Hyposmocoma kahamanoa]|uniref:zinc finger protein 782-like isoform X1 n=1 Tax=Hyposmocoma kahamanoa TaxID=1477025 RepID=UPI000E6D7D91|nr:zinc finger protein 782-like isoform X1 [Hyposmocoma kahamanoa]
MSRRHPSAESKIKCELCEKRVNRNRLRRHVAIAHGTSALRCGYCKSEYDSKEVLIEHVVTCTAKKKTRKICESSRELQECDICHKRMQKASLRMHKAVTHAGLRPHCGRNFGNNYRLNEHCRAKHGYEKLKCSYCDFESAGVMALRNHERRHRNEKPFVCETCGAKFHAAYLLAQHKKSHRTEKLIKCNLCPATFKANNSLHTHKLSCHSNYLYKCHLCSRVYSSRHYAVKHLRHVHDYKGPVPQLQKVPNEVIIP